MTKMNNRAANAWSKLYKVESKWNATKEKLEKLKLWNSYCDVNGWSHTANFHDIGA